MARTRSSRVVSAGRRWSRCVWATAALLLLAGCHDQRETAQESIKQIESMLNVGAFESARYVPEQFNDVQGSLRRLKASFGQADYQAVQRDAPAILRAAHALPSAAAAKKTEIAERLGAEWSALSSALPDDLTVIRKRIELLGTKTGKKLKIGIDVETAQSRMRQAAPLWSKAQAAFATGNLDEAVATAERLKNSLDALAHSLGLDLQAS